MASSYLMRLGGFRFSLHTAAYQQLHRVTGYRWNSQERVGRLPGQQYLGPGEDTITLSGVIYADFQANNPIARLNAMRAEAGMGKPLMLVDGTGHIWQRWVIQQIEETQRTLFPDGSPRLVEFRLQLSRYGEDT